MNSFRSFVSKHISRSSLIVLVAFGITSLGAVGQTFVKNVETTFAEIDLNIAPSAVANVYEARHTKLPSTPPPSTEVPNRSLAQDESSKEVLELQNFLKWRGFWPMNEPLTGYFGDVTLQSVKKYQEAMKINPEGIVGPLTRQMWENDIAKSKDPL
jgi:peptidoglycan hydrolase-like protein with peptidoglycan-binding domain